MKDLIRLIIETLSKLFGSKEPVSEPVIVNEPAPVVKPEPIVVPAPTAKPLARGFKLGSRSLERLQGVHPDLIKVVKRAIEITEVDFTVLEGVRTLERQKKLYASGASKTLNSRHLTGHAVDIAPWIDNKVSWDWDYYYPLAEAVKKAALELGVSVEWGGDWKSFKDGPHWQLPWAKYPK